MAVDTYTPRLKTEYEGELRSRLKEELGVASIMQVPKVSKITLNMGVGEAKLEAKTLDNAMDQLTTIAGQRAQLRRARKSIAAFKLREGMPIGAKVTLRGDRMYEFLDRLVVDRAAANPRLPRALAPLFDGRGNYSIGIREQIIFPEIDYDSVDKVRGLDVTITTTAETDEQAYALLRGLGLPFARGQEGAVSGEEVARREGGTSAEVQDAPVQPVQPLRPAARGVQEVRPLPDLPAHARARRRDPGHDQIELVI